MDTSYVHCAVEYEKVVPSVSKIDRTNEYVDGPLVYSTLSQAESKPDTDQYDDSACVAYTQQEPIYDQYNDQYSERLSTNSDYEYDASYQGSSCGACVAYADHNRLPDYDYYSPDKMDRYSYKRAPSSTGDNIYAYIEEYEEIDDDGAEYSEILKQFYVVFDENADKFQPLQKPSLTISCIGSILNPHQLLFGWKSKVPWTCQTSLRTWSRVLSAKMGVQFSVSTSGPSTTVTFLRRALKDYNARIPSTIPHNEMIPANFLHNIQIAFDIAKRKPTRYKRVIGIDCFPIHMSMPRTMWKDIRILTEITSSKEQLFKKNRRILATTDVAADRLGQLHRVLVSYHSKRYDLPENSLKTFIADTGPNFRYMHTSMFAMKALRCLAKRGQSVLLPEPCHPTLTVWFNVFQYSTGVTPRYYRRDPMRSWLLDLGSIQEILDDKVAAVFISNPSVIGGGLSSYRELDILVKMLEKRGIPLIAEENSDYLVYDQQQPAHSVLELKPNIPLIVVNSCYRWMVFGGQGPRLAWALVYDPQSRLESTFYDTMKEIQDQSMKQQHPSALPLPSVFSSILHYDGWANDIVRYLAKNVSIAVGILSKTPGLYVIIPKAGNFVVVLINFDEFGGKFHSDVEWTTALFNEESVKVVCGSLLVGWKNSFALELYMRRDLLIAACERIDEFCNRHCKRAVIL